MSDRIRRLSLSRRLFFRPRALVKCARSSEVAQLKYFPSCATSSRRNPHVADHHTHRVVVPTLRNHRSTIPLGDEQRTLFHPSLIDDGSAPHTPSLAAPEARFSKTSVIFDRVFHNFSPYSRSIIKLSATVFCFGFLSSPSFVFVSVLLLSFCC